MRSFRPSPRVAALLLLVGVGVLIVVNMLHSYSLGQYRTMYDNPIYRWRVSVAVALSQLRDPPLPGYVAYGSINNYLNRHGLALLRGEAAPLPYPDAVKRLIYDSGRLEALFQKAFTVTLDHKLPPVPIVGNEKGEAAYYYLAFRLFGIHITSFWWLYFTFLTVSSLIFFLTFWRAPKCILFLMIYLSAHFYMLDLVTVKYFQTVHNSRFFTVLALLPSLHLLLLVLRRERPTWIGLTLAAGQILLLFFLIFCRTQVAWQPAGIMLIAALWLPYRSLWSGSWHARSLALGARRAVAAGWPAILIIAGGLGLLVYQKTAIDREAYATETADRSFWDAVVCGTVSASPQLLRLYGLGTDIYTDTMGYLIAREYIRTHNLNTLPIVYIANGEIQIDVMKGMGTYDKVMRRVFFDMAATHPWLVVKSFIYDKPRDQIMWFSQMKIIFSVAFYWSVTLTIISMLYVWIISAPPLYREEFKAAVWVMPLAAFLSSSTVFITPTLLIADTIMVLLMLLLATLAFGSCWGAKLLQNRRKTLAGVPASQLAIPLRLDRPS